MKKTVLSLAVLLFLPTLSACGNSGTQGSSNTQKEEPSQASQLDKVEDYLKNDKYYQAMDMLEAVKDKGTSDEKQEADAILDQIELYQTAEENIQDDRYKVAEENLDEVIEKDNGSAVMRDKADELKSEAEKKQEEKDKEEKEQKEEKAKEEKSNNKKGGSVGSSRSSASWSSSKSSRLYSFMDSWATQMGQTYYEMDFDESVVTLGDYSVDDLVDGTATPLVNGSEVSFNYSGGSGYEVVAVYDGATNDGTDTAYVFALGPNGPVALVAQGLANGRHGYVNFKPTANSTLQSGFANIANS